MDDKLLTHLSPLGWEHINLIGDYIWRQSKGGRAGEISAVMGARKVLAYDFFRFVSWPQGGSQISDI